jgi:hypothetical protein
MMGGAKKGAANAAAPTAGSRRVVGTIAEAAAIARAAADHEPAQPIPPRETPTRVSGRRDRRSHRAPEREASETAPPADGADAPSEGGAEDPAPRRKGSVDPAQVGNADRTVEHLILAERAYAYGRSIVEAGPEPKKPGETVEIES